MVIKNQTTNPIAKKHRLHIFAKLVMFIGLCILPILGMRQMWIEIPFIWPAVIYALLSTITFVCYWNDKRRAENGQRRITENSLHLFDGLGGWPGGLLAQQLFRHKTRKLRFQVIFWLIVSVHQAFWIDWFLSRGHYASLVLNFLVGRY